MVPTLLIDETFLCCPGCKVLNEPVTELVPIEEDHPVILPWLVGSLEEHPGVGYWLSFNQRLPISYELGDQLYRLLHHGQLVRDEEDVEGEIAEDTIEEEVI